MVQQAIHPLDPRYMPSRDPDFHREVFTEEFQDDNDETASVLITYTWYEGPERKTISEYKYRLVDGAVICKQGLKELVEDAIRGHVGEKVIFEL